ncbi:hypothetical protein [Sulfitobacter sp.]|uniref:hypothetical protein n=1 Tax=Sulfitobacter sp. TaxID=1903071 RepID=UPI003F6CF903
MTNAAPVDGGGVCVKTGFTCRGLSGGFTPFGRENRLDIRRNADRFFGGPCIGLGLFLFVGDLVTHGMKPFGLLAGRYRHGLCL